MSEETIFAAGFVFKRPHESAPDFVKGSLSLKADEAVDFIKKYTKPDGWVNLDLLASKDNTKLYFKLNTFTPKKKIQLHHQMTQLTPQVYLSNTWTAQQKPS